MRMVSCHVGTYSLQQLQYMAYSHVTNANLPGRHTKSPMTCFTSAQSLVSVTKRLLNLTIGYDSQ
jgi:hypothetical protein